MKIVILMIVLFMLVFVVGVGSVKEFGYLELMKVKFVCLVDIVWFCNEIEFGKGCIMMCLKVYEVEVLKKCIDVVIFYVVDVDKLINN